MRKVADRYFGDVAVLLISAQPQEKVDRYVEKVNRCPSPPWPSLHRPLITAVPGAVLAPDAVGTQAWSGSRGRECVLVATF